MKIIINLQKQGSGSFIFILLYCIILHYHYLCGVTINHSIEKTCHYFKTSALNM